MDLSILKGLKDYVNIEIRNPDNLIQDVKHLTARHLTGTARNMIFEKNLIDPQKMNTPPAQIDLSKYFSVNITEKAKKRLLWAGLGLAALFIFMNRKK